MIVGRSVTQDTRLSARERRSFRRIEDATVAEDPLLDLRLGLPPGRLTRTVVGLRRRLKAIGRLLARRPKSALGVAVVVLVVMSFLAFQAGSVALLLCVPCAFCLGVAISRSRQSLAADATAPRSCRLD